MAHFKLACPANQIRWYPCITEGARLVQGSFHSMAMIAQQGVESTPVSLPFP